MSGTTSGLFTELTRHQIPVADLDAIAAGRVRGRTAERLTSAERSRRMLMLRAVAAAEQEVGISGTGPLPPVAAAFDLLADAERAQPEAVADVLGHPAVGVWAVRILGRLRAKSAAAEDEPPVWHELGYVHTLAGAAALRAGRPAKLRVPVWSGTVSLPTVGQAVFPDPGGGYDVAVLDTGASGTGPATLTRGPERLLLPRNLGQSVSGWRPSRRLNWRLADQAHNVLLDDTDPYRDFRTCYATTDPLGAPESDRWQQLLDEAGELLTARHQHAARLMGFGLKTLVPLPRMPRFRTSSASYTEAFGSAMVSLPRDAVDLAVTLVHEVRHSVLNGLNHQVRLFERPAAGESDVLLYAPWRTDPRPPWGLLHGAYAFAGVVEFWRAERHVLTGPEADLAHFEFGVWRDAVAVAIESLGVQSSLTAWGRRFVHCLSEQTSPWAQDSLPPRLLALARAQTADLRATWRVRQLRPDLSATRRLTDRWLNGDDPEDTEDAPVSRLRSDPLPGSPELRGELRRRLLAEGGALTDRMSALPLEPDRHPALLTADLDLVNGEAARAAHGYRMVLSEDPGSRAAWIGLGLALSTKGEDAAARALLDRPEVVRAVYLRARSSGRRAFDPVELCHWIKRVPGLMNPR